MGSIRINSNAISAAGGEFASYAEYYNALMNKLKDDATILGKSWQSEAGEKFQRTFDTHQETLIQMKQALEEFSELLEKTGNSFKNAENTIMDNIR